MIRGLVLYATIMALFVLWQNRPTPVKTVQVDYCVIYYHGAAKDELGEWHTGWVAGYGPCSLQDKYFEI